MKDRPLREPDQIRRACAQKLCAVETSRLFHAVLGCLVGEEWTVPHIEEMRITADKSVQARVEGEWQFKTFRGAEVHLIRRIHDVARVAHLDGDEVGYTRSRLPVVLVYQESQASRSLALKREVAIKALTRQQKESLLRESEPIK